jgi:hypothetical protein
MNNYRYLLVAMLLVVLCGGAALTLVLGHPSVALLLSSLFCLTAAEHLYHLGMRNRRMRNWGVLLRPASLVLPCGVVALLWYSAGHLH